MHLKRWITAVIALPLVVLLILRGGQALFSLTIAVISVLTMVEYFRIAFHNHHPKVPWVYSTWTCASGAVVVAAAHYAFFMGIVYLLSLHLLGCGLLAVFRFNQSQDSPIVAVKSVFAILYISLLFSFLQVLAELYLLVLAWAFFRTVELLHHRTVQYIVYES